MGKNKKRPKADNYVGSVEDPYLASDYDRLIFWLAGEAALYDAEVQGFGRLINDKGWRDHPDAAHYKDVVEALESAFQHYLTAAPDAMPSMELQEAWATAEMREAYFMYATLDIARRIKAGQYEFPSDTHFTSAVRVHVGFLFEP